MRPIAEQRRRWMPVDAIDLGELAMSSISAAAGNSLQYLSQATVNTQSGQSLTTASPPQAKKHHHGGAGDTLSKLQSAVSSALSSNDASSTDPNTAITNAIANFLKQGSGTGGDPDGDGSSATTSTTATGGQTFAELLAAHGVSGEAFGADLQAGFQQAQSASGGTTSTTGNLLDVAA